MQLHQIALIAASFAVGSMAQFTDCKQLKSGYGYICSPDGSTVRYCQHDKEPKEVDSQYCDFNDCRANQEQGFCESGIGRRNIAHGPTDCSKVNPDRGYVCSSDYRILYQCSGFNKAQADNCQDAICFASTTGDQGQCIRG